MKIVHISDLHFGRFFRSEVAEDLQLKLASIDHDAVVVSGDLTQRAKAREFDMARAYLRNLGSSPVLVVPGNHDIPLYRVWERLTKPLEGFNTLSQDFQNQLTTDRAIVVGIDSTDPWRALVNGRVSQTQLDVCKRMFADMADDRWRILVMHHHLLPPPGYDRRQPMPKADRLLDALNEIGIDIVLSGHLHRAYVGNTLDIHAGNRRNEGIVVIQCGTSTSRRGRGFERKKNSFNVIELLQDELLVEHWMYFDPPADATAKAEFISISSHRFKRTASR